MPQVWKILLQWFHGGIANHDTYVGENQVAYAENVFLRNPEYVTLNQKPENYALTDNDLALCMNETRWYWHDYFGTEWGNMYDAGSNVKRCDTALNSYILNIFTVWTYVYFCMSNSRIWRILIDDLVDWPTRWWWQLQSEWSYTETYLTWSGDYINKYILRWWGDLDAIWWNGWWLKYISSAFSVSARGSIRSSSIGLWKTQNYIKAFWARGNLYWNDWANSVYNAELDLDSLYIEWIKLKDTEILISGILSQNSHLFVPNGEGKTLIASARLSWPDNKKVHYYGRNDFAGMANKGERQNGNDTHWSYNELWYVINNTWVASYWKILSWMPDAWNIDWTRNYNNDVVSSVGFIKILSSVTWWNTYLYYSWRSWSVCWVDRVDLDKMNNPDKFVNNGMIYTQKYNFWDAKTYIKKLKIRADTTTGQTIKVYSSVDGWAWTLKQTLNNTTAKKFFLLDAHEEAYTIQWKLELETDDEDLSPKLYAMSFIYEIPDNE
jgi:hypothetical protein